jgi:hypothetical protein
MTEQERFELNIAIGSATFNAVGDAERVMAALEEFAELMQKVPDLGGGADGGDHSEEAPPPAEQTGGGSSVGQKMVLPLFLREKNPSGNPMVATAIVAWAEVHDGKAGLTAPQARALWRGTSLRAPGNLNRDMEMAVRQGLLHKEGNSYSVTGHGKEKLGLLTH